MTIGSYIKMERHKRGMTLRDFAKKSGLASSTISGVETDKFHRFSTIKVLLETLDLSIDDATNAGVEWFEEKKKPEPTTFETVVDYITADAQNEERVRRFLAYLDGLKKRGGS